MNTTPADTITKLIEARRSRDFAAALGCYEPDATVIVQPGQIASGAEALKHT